MAFDPKVSPLAPLIELPGTRTMTLQECLQIVANFMGRMVGMEFIILAHRKSDPIAPGYIAGTRSVGLEAGRCCDLLKVAVVHYEKTGGSGLVAPH